MNRKNKQTNHQKGNKNPQLKVAIVHDYIKDYGGAERVLKVISDMFPQAPIYTAFITPGSAAAKAFSSQKIIPWKYHWLINRWNLHSPLRFLIPLIWESFDFKEYDLVISSASGYITKSIITQPHTTHLCYCHTPPRFLWGLPTARQFNFWLAKIYGNIISHFLRQYDYLSAQRVDYFIANSKNTAKRIKKFYGRESTVIYPPVALSTSSTSPRSKFTYSDYFLVVSRLVGTKGWELLNQAAQELPDKNFLIVGGSSGLKLSESKWKNSAPKNIQWLGRVSDSQLYQLYTHAIAFLALAENEDFGMTLVESMSAGTPVIAYAGGGYLETVVEGKTGTFFHEYNATSLVKAIKHFQASLYRPADCRAQARKFSKQNFKKQIREAVSRCLYQN